MPADRDGHQHGPLSAHRGTLADHSVAHRIAARDAASVHDYDQVGPRFTRYRPPEAGRGPSDCVRSAVGNLIGSEIARTLEPRAPQPRKRLAAVKALNDAGIPCFVAIAPVVPQVTDHELEHIVEAAVAAGAPGGFYFPVRLPHEVAPLFRAWLDEHYPDRASKVMATIRSLRGGRDNDPDFFSRMRGQGPWADLLRTRFEIACKHYGLRKAKFRSHRPVSASRGRADAAALIVGTYEFNRLGLVTCAIAPYASDHEPSLFAASFFPPPPRNRPAVYREAATPVIADLRSQNCATMHSPMTIMPGTSSKG